MRARSGKTGKTSERSLIIPFFSKLADEVLPGSFVQSASSIFPCRLRLLRIYAVRRGNVFLKLLKNFLWFRASRQFPNFGVGAGDQAVMRT
jgi:hypothetical protein